MDWCRMENAFDRDLLIVHSCTINIDCGIFFRASKAEHLASCSHLAESGLPDSRKTCRLDSHIHTSGVFCQIPHRLNLILLLNIDCLGCSKLCRQRKTVRLHVAGDHPGPS